MEKPSIVQLKYRQPYPRKRLEWKPFLKALSEVVVSDIEFLATGECAESSDAKVQSIKNKEPNK